MGRFVVEKTVKMMIAASQHIKGKKVGVLGFTFKENCPDLRNTRVVDIVEELASYGCEVLVHDPTADANEAKKYYGVDLCGWEELADLGALILAVPHAWYCEQPVAAFTSKLLPAKGCLVDVKSVLDLDAVEKTGVRFWRL